MEVFHSLKDCVASAIMMIIPSHLGRCRIDPTLITEVIAGCSNWYLRRFERAHWHT